jgi:FkbM family methyltransferase
MKANVETSLESVLRASCLDDLIVNLQSHYPGFNVRNVKTLAIVGAAGEGRRLARLCRKHAINIAAHVDDDSTKAGTVIEGLAIASVSTLERLNRTTPVVIASHRLIDATERLRALGFTTVLPFAALQIMARDLFPPHMFYDGLLDDLWANRERYVSLRESLADLRSHEVLDAVLAFRQTLDPTFLRPVLDSNDLYAPKGLFKFSNHEIYVEGGSYDGDTIRAFISRVGGSFERVYAFEPDPATFERLCRNFADEPRVEPINLGLHSRKGILRFRNDASRGAIFADDGDIKMPVTTLDETLAGRPASYIKMNIEGAEIDALHGSERTIRRNRPKLALSVYHRPSDLWRIPPLVRKISSDYRLYLRQHDGGIIETVLYALPPT